MCVYFLQGSTCHGGHRRQTLLLLRVRLRVSEGVSLVTLVFYSPTLMVKGLGVCYTANNLHHTLCRPMPISPHENTGVFFCGQGIPLLQVHVRLVDFPTVWPTASYLSTDIPKVCGLGRYTDCARLGRYTEQGKQVEFTGIDRPGRYRFGVSLL